MPCGPKDKRRVSRRCLRCRNDHLKCDGSRPCTACRKKSLPCDSHPTVGAVRIILKPQPTDYKLFACPSVIKAENYGDIFFYAIGLSPVILTVFSIESLKPLAHDNRILRETISLLGGTYASRNPHLLTLSPSDKSDLRSNRISLRTWLQAQLDGSTINEQSNVILTCGLLLSFVELLDDPLEDAWNFWVLQLHTFSKRSPKSGPPSLFERSLHRLARILNALRAISLETDPIIEVSARLPFLGLRQYRFPPSFAGSSVSRSEQLLEYVAVDLETWSQLQWWIIQWEAGDSRLKPEGNFHATSATSETLSPHQVEGIEIVCIASKFQRDIVATLVWYSKQYPGKSARVMGAIYTCIALDISQLFTKPVWLSLRCELPVMPLKLSYDQAIVALRHAEASVEHLNLEAIFFAPILYAIGMQMARKTDRNRILDFVGTLKEKGFAVSDRFLATIERQWSAANSDKLRNRGNATRSERLLKN